MPLSADVAPQMTLFGSAPRTNATALAAPPPPINGTAVTAGAEAERSNATPAFERRALLRAERHRLVSDLRRRDGSSHREINAWLNRKLGVASVEQATIEELERSVELLVGELIRKR